MKLLTLAFILISCWSNFFAQEVTVKATTNPKEINAILAKEREAGRINRAFFEEDDRCRELLKLREWPKAESSCRLAVALVEKLPAEHVLERSSARVSLAVALLWHRKTSEAIPLLKRSLEIRIPKAGEADADTADIYAILGSAYGSTGEVQTARLYFEKAESSYRAAFLDIGDDCDGMRFSYPRRMKNALEAHYELVKTAGTATEAEKLRARLAEVESEFAKYLDGQYKPADICK